MRRSERLSTQVTSDFKKQIDKHCKKRGLSISEVLRQALLEKVELNEN